MCLYLSYTSRPLRNSHLLPTSNRVTCLASSLLLLSHKPGNKETKKTVWCSSSRLLFPLYHLACNQVKQDWIDQCGLLVPLVRVNGIVDELVFRIEFVRV